MVILVEFIIFNKLMYVSCYLLNLSILYFREYRIY